MRNSSNVETSFPTANVAGLSEIRRSTLAEEVAAQIQRAIISGTIPEGSPVSEAQLADQLNVSRVPVREALSELEHAGIIVFNFRGRGHVRQFSRNDFQEILALRLTLESMSVRLATAHLSAEDITALERNLSAMEAEQDLTNISRLDVEFHDLIMQTSRHQRLIRCWQTVRTQFELLLAKAHRWQKYHDFPVNDHALRGHRPIFQALLSGDPENAVREMQKHIHEWAEWMPLEESPAHS